MQREFFSDLEQILYEKEMGVKFEKFEHFYENFKGGGFFFNADHPSIFRPNSHEKIRLLHPTRLRRPKFANSHKALAKLIHSIAHIEFSAINLALDACYRFKNLPLAFYEDWLEVACDEMRHFKLLNLALKELGFEYGSFPAHDNFEEALRATKDSLKFRMGVVHRGLEAKGLDANPFIVKKLQSSPHPIRPLLEEILGTILRDEIRHVQKGDLWWKFAKDEREDFIALCEKFKKFNLAGKKLNTKARLAAGFEAGELEQIAKFYSFCAGEKG